MALRCAAAARPQPTTMTRRGCGLFVRFVLCFIKVSCLRCSHVRGCTLSRFADHKDIFPAYIRQEAGARFFVYILLRDCSPTSICREKERLRSFSASQRPPCHTGQSRIGALLCFRYHKSASSASASILFTYYILYWKKNVNFQGVYPVRDR